jgi:hypothetical protein
MHKIWEDRGDPVARFWSRLHHDCVDKLINDPEKFLLRHMRHDHDMVLEYQKRFGYIFEERGVSLYALIAKACGEIWDDEDEEKGTLPPRRKKVVPIKQKKPTNAISLGPACASRVPEGKGEGPNVPRSNGSSEKNLGFEESRRRFEESFGRSGGGGPAIPEEEEASKKKSPS